MPYRIRKQACTRSDGKKGKYVLKYKPKSKTSKKKDSEGFVKAGCHTSKDKANAQRAAIEGGPREARDISLRLIDNLNGVTQDELLEAAIEEDKDQNKDGNNDFEDVKIARMKASGMTDAEIKKKYPELYEAKKKGGHLAQYKPGSKSIRGMTRGEALDKTKEDLKKAKKLRKQGKAGKAKELEQRAYNRRESMEKKERAKQNEAKLRRMIREVLLNEAKKKKRIKMSAKTEKALKKKAESKGYTLGSLKQEYNKGLGAYYSSGSRKGMSPHQWAMARVNSAMEGGKSWAVVKKSKAKKK